MQDKFCVNCKHYNDDAFTNDCTRFLRWQKTDKVTGVVSKLYTNCGAARFEESKCGPEGKLFEPNFKYKIISIIKGVFK